MAFIANIADLRREARKRLPTIVYDYVENGGYEQETLLRNRTDLADLALVPRVLNDVSKRTIAKTLLGKPVQMPVGLAPVGACGLTYPNGEVHAAKAALAHGVPFCLSTLSICTIEDVAEATKAPFWFQLYPMRDKSVTEALVERAKAAGCSAIVLSLDLHVRSRRHPEARHGLMAPPRITPSNIADALSHPAWLLSMAGSKRRTFGNLIGLVKDAKNVPKITEWLEQQFDPTLSVESIDHLTKVWPGKLLVKGIMHPGDARMAAEHGADAVVVSNHGGRQVDGAVSTAFALPAVVEAIKGRAEIIVDSGIRSGIDVLKMLALGADACLIGRAYLYGLAARGERGVSKALQIIAQELDENMALCGITDISRLPHDLLVSDRIALPQKTRHLL